MSDKAALLELWNSLPLEIAQACLILAAKNCSGSYHKVTEDVEFGKR